jgi:hypothetical protein
MVCRDPFNRDTNSTSLREALPPKMITDAYPNTKAAEPPINVRTKTITSPYSEPLLRGLKVKKMADRYKRTIKPKNTRAITDRLLDIINP